VVYATGQKPASGGSTIASWNLEAALDIEWAHAMAPNAKIYLVEAASESTSDLMYAVKVASQISGVKEISMSWGSNEVQSETSYDSYFNTSGIVYVASSGGPSQYESRPSFQSKIASTVGSKRGTADISFDANPNTGVNVYDSTSYEGESGWWVLGGTSVAAPSLAGVINVAATSNTFATNGTAELTRIYNLLGNSSDFRDITSGTDGSYSCATGWDYITGVGSPLGLGGK
jgi:subtilase family serine protease